jgi:hypothetical protein
MSDLMTSGAPDALLHKLRVAVVGEVHTDNDLTLRQMAVALTLYLSSDPQTVRGLARHLQDHMRAHHGAVAARRRSSVPGQQPGHAEHLEAAMLKPAKDRAVFILSAAGKASPEAAGEAGA